MRRIASVGIALTLATSVVRAQSVRGVVSRGNVPVAGVVVQLIDSTDAVQFTSISDDRGVYRVLAAREGTYRLLARRVGFQPTRTATFVLRSGPAREQPIELSSLTVTLDTVRVRAAKCAVLAHADADVATVWEQTKTALLATNATTASRPLSTMLMQYQHTERAGVTTVRSVNVQDEDSTGVPWHAPSPRVMRDKGYAHWLTPNTMEFWAPSLEVLSSNEFAEDHCAKLDDGSDAETLVLVFEPRRKKRDFVDITGHMLVDRRTAELRELTFRYTNVDSAVQSDAGGRMQFARARDGSWLVSDWFIRVPIADTASTRSPRAPRAVAYSEIAGGRVYVARRDDDTVFVAPYPTLTGIVRDSLAGKPIAGAQLFLRESARLAVADSTGRFTLGRVRPGVHTLQVNTASLDSLGAASVKRILVTDSLAASSVRVPSLRQALDGMCGRQGAPSAAGMQTVMHGVISSTLADSVTMRDSLPPQVRAVWMDPFTSTAVRYSVRAEANGQYRLCGAPADTWIDVYAERGDLSSVPVRVTLKSASPFGVKHFELRLRDSSEATLHGVVRDSRDRIISGALIAIDSLQLRAVTDMTGEWRFPRVTAGAVRVTVRRVGFAPLDTTLIVSAGRETTLDLRIQALARLVEEPRTADDSARLNSTAALQAAAFEARRRGAGQFMARNRLEKAEGKPLSELLRTILDAVLTPFGTQGAVLRSAATTFRCPSTVMLDGRPLYAGVGDPPDINLFDASQIESLEWYSSERDIPAVFRGLAGCGLLVVHARYR